LWLNPDWSWDHERCAPVVARAKLVIVPNPNSPSGNRWSDADLLRLVPPHGILVVDEAYGDFADRPHRGELLRSEAGGRIVVTRSFSKSYSLAGVRMGFAMADPELVAGMRKVKDSYNCDALAQAAALAALEDQAGMEANAERIRATRRRLSAAMTERGFRVIDSQANFVWCTHADGRHRERYEALKQRRILVRFMRFPEAGGPGTPTLDGLRITVGTDAEIDHLLTTLDALGL
jgi:histidinol-phosphate aminotransferase